MAALLALLAGPAVARQETCEPIHPESGIDPPVATYTVEPEYPALARKARIQGVVILSSTVRADGTVGEVTVLKGLPMGLNDKAIEAVRQRRFEPAMRNGEPLCVQYNQTVNFQLQEETMFGGRVTIPASGGDLRMSEPLTVDLGGTGESSAPPIALWGLGFLVLNLLGLVVWVVALILGLRLLIWVLHRLGFPEALGRFGSAVARAYRNAEADRDNER